MSNIVVTNLLCLSVNEGRQARYLSALGRYRLLAAEFVTTGQVSRADLVAALNEVKKWEPAVEERLLPLRGVLARFEGQVSESTIRRWAKDGQVARVRDGRVWLYDPNDVELCIVTASRPRALGSKKIRGK